MHFINFFVLFCIFCSLVEAKFGWFPILKFPPSVCSVSEIILYVSERLKFLWFINVRISWLFPDLFEGHVLNLSISKIIYSSSNKIYIIKIIHFKLFPFINTSYNFFCFFMWNELNLSREWLLSVNESICWNFKNNFPIFA